MGEPFCIRIERDTHCFSVEESTIWSVKTEKELLIAEESLILSSEPMIYQVGFDNDRYVIFAHKASYAGQGISNSVIAEICGGEAPFKWKSVMAEVEKGFFEEPPGLVYTGIKTIDNTVYAIFDKPLSAMEDGLIYFSNPVSIGSALNTVSLAEELFKAYKDAFLSKYSCEEVESTLKTSIEKYNERFDIFPGCHPITSYVEKELLPKLKKIFPAEITEGVNIGYGSRITFGSESLASYSVKDDTIRMGTEFIELPEIKKIIILAHELGHRYYSKHNPDIMETLMNIGQFISDDGIIDKLSSILKYGKAASKDCASMIYGHALYDILKSIFPFSDPFDELFSTAFEEEAAKKTGCYPDETMGRQKVYAEAVVRLPLQFSIPFTVWFIYDLEKCPLLSFEVKSNVVNALKEVFDESNFKEIKEYVKILRIGDEPAAKAAGVKIIPLL